MKSNIKDVMDKTEFNTKIVPAIANKRIITTYLNTKINNMVATAIKTNFEESIRQKISELLETDGDKTTNNKPTRSISTPMRKSRR